ncbi:MAG: hypothetical protein ACRDLL_10720 [Solirubrobacterales bacterium]
MNPIDTAAARDLLETAVTAVSILGGVMACTSGYAASQAMAEGQRPEILGQRVNEGIAEGFAVGWPLAVLVFIIGAWS